MKYITTHLSLFCFIFLFGSNSLFSQDSRRLERALIFEETLFSPFYVVGGDKLMQTYIDFESVYIRKTSLRESHKLILSDIFLFAQHPIGFNDCWHIADDSSFIVSQVFSGRIAGNAVIRYEHIAEKDTTTLSQEAKQRLEICKENRNKCEQIYEKMETKRFGFINSQILNNLGCLFSFQYYQQRAQGIRSNFWDAHNFSNAILVDEPQEFTYFLRDSACVYSWRIQLPRQGDVDITETQSFCRVSKDVKVFPYEEFMKQYGRRFPEVKFYKDCLPTLENAHYNAITDTLFFDGNFKAYSHNEKIWFINQKHGGIYYLGEKNIEKIGILQVDNIHFLIDGIKLFIEDRDNKQLIFFAPVEWMRDDLPKPNVRIITDEKEFKEMFKYVLE